MCLPPKTRLPARANVPSAKPPGGFVRTLPRLPPLPASASAPLSAGPTAMDFATAFGFSPSTTTPFRFSRSPMEPLSSSALLSPFSFAMASGSFFSLAPPTPSGTGTQLPLTASAADSISLTPLSAFFPAPTSTTMTTASLPISSPNPAFTQYPCTSSASSSGSADSLSQMDFDLSAWLSSSSRPQSHASSVSPPSVVPISKDDAAAAAAGASAPSSLDQPLSESSDSQSSPSSSPCDVPLDQAEVCRAAATTAAATVPTLPAVASAKNSVSSTATAANTLASSDNYDSSDGTLAVGGYDECPPLSALCRPTDCMATIFEDSARALYADFPAIALELSHLQSALSESESSQPMLAAAGNGVAASAASLTALDSDLSFGSGDASGCESGAINSSNDTAKSAGPKGRKRRLVCDLPPYELAKTREINRLAAQRHRMIAKQKMAEKKQQFDQLNKRNDALRRQVQDVSMELNTLKKLVVSMYGPGGARHSLLFPASASAASGVSAPSRS